MASITSPAGIPPSNSAERTSTPRFAHGLAYGMLVSMPIWAMIGFAVYKLI